jgi:hypothetical protein
MIDGGLMAVHVKQEVSAGLTLIAPMLCLEIQGRGGLGDKGGLGALHLEAL